MDSKSFIDSVFERHYDALFKYCLSKLDGDEQAAQDAVDAVYIAALRRDDELVSHSDPRGWLYGTAYNTVKNIRKTRARYVKRHLLFDPSLFSFFGADDRMDRSVPKWEREVRAAWSFEDKLFSEAEPDDGEILRIKEQILGCLTPEERELFRAYYDEKADLTELAERYSLSKQAVCMRIKRISAKVANRLKIYFQEVR